MRSGATAYHANYNAQQRDAIPRDTSGLRDSIPAGGDCQQESSGGAHSMASEED